MRTDTAPAPARPVWPFPARLLEYPVAPPIPRRAPTPKPTLPVEPALF